jgi:hypothetical protein
MDLVAVMSVYTMNANVLRVVVVEAAPEARKLSR